MRRQDKQIEDPARLEAILRQVKLCHLGLFDGESPYVVPVHIGYDIGRFYFHGAREGRKMRILAERPKLAFQAHLSYEILLKNTPCGCSTRYESVMGQGLAHLVDDEAEAQLGLLLLLHQCGAAAGKISPERLAKTAVVRVDVISLTGKGSPPELAKSERKP